MAKCNMCNHECHCKKDNKDNDKCSNKECHCISCYCGGGDGVAIIGPIIGGNDAIE